MAGALGGGLIGFQLMSGTTLGKRLHLPGPLPRSSAAAGCAVTFLFGGQLLGMLPVGLFVTVVAYLGMDFLATWLWIMRPQLSRTDYGVVLFILLVSAVVGFFEALGVGVLVAASLFILSFAQVDVVRLRSTLSTRRSLVERSNDDIRHLMQNGDHVVVLELAGFLFFGTANALLKSIRSEIAAAKKPNVIILDFSRVRGLDASASHSLGKLSKACARAAVRLVYTGLRPGLEQAYLRGASDINTAKLLPTLDVALRTEEDHLLARRSPGGENAALPLGALALIADPSEGDGEARRHPAAARRGLDRDVRAAVGCDAGGDLAPRRGAWRGGTLRARRHHRRDRLLLGGAAHGDGDRR